MGDKFIESTIDNFFETGVLECSIFQLNSIYEYAKNKLSTFKPTQRFTEEQTKWLNFYKMILIYMTEEKVRINGVNKALKVDFNNYLLKVFGISVGEVSADEYDILFSKYKLFVDENCCSKCLDAGNTKACMNCPCGESIFF